MLFARNVVLGLLLGSTAVGVARAQEEPRKYDRDFSDQDLTEKSFRNENLENSNFENADLTRADFEGATLNNCNFQGAEINGTRFTKADLTGSDFRSARIIYPGMSQVILNEVNLSGMDLSRVGLSNIKLRKANLQNVKGMGEIYGCDFFGADLRGANFQKAVDLPDPLAAGSAKFRKVMYDSKTRWHKGFDPEAAGAVLVEEEETPEPPPVAKPAADLTKEIEKEFANLDINEDGVLSGKEMRPFPAFDADGDGEVTLAEFIAGRTRDK